MAAARPRRLSLLQLLRCALCLCCGAPRADGQLFLLEAQNGSAEAGGATAAQEACARHAARLATAAELRHAVVECSFATCTRGWLAGPSIGITVCSELGSGQQTTKPVDVTLENVTATSGHLDIFCMKERGSPCGDPPTFAHTVLQSHTGLELGDELLYVCAPGFIMPGGRSAFSLLCDSCGEWYGLVQPCGKDETETQVDYEIPDEEHAVADRTGDAEETSFREDDGLASEESEPGQKQDGRPGEEMSTAEEEQQTRGREEGDVEYATEKIGHELTAGTDAPVSLLSQKHLFWFPSETFHEPDRPGVPGVTVAPAWEEEEDNHIGVKASGSEADSIKAHSQRDSVPRNTAKTGPLNYTRVVVRGPGPESDESWLDGYPVTQDAGEEGGRRKEEGGLRDVGRPTTETAEEDETGRKVPSKIEHMDDSRPDYGSSAPSSDSAYIAVPPTRPGDYGGKHFPMRLTPPSSPESVHVGLHPSTRHSIAEHTHIIAASPEPDIPDHPADHGDGRKVKVAPTAPWYTTKSQYPFLDHLPGPTKREEVTVPYQKAPPGTVAPDLIGEFAGTDLYDESIERNLTQLGPAAGIPPTEGPCMGEGCPLAGQGPVVPIVVVAACALVVAAVLGVWCYKRKQQKSSVYKMNGKGQSRPPQHIEMQQKV